MNKTRKIIQIAAVTLQETKYSFSYTIVLCDDGTVWSMRMDGNSEWFMCPPVPQEEIEHES